MRTMQRWLAIVALVLAGPLGAQPNGILLIAKPGLPDPNFSQTVVLVTHTDEGSPVGVIPCPAAGVVAEARSCAGRLSRAGLRPRAASRRRPAPG